ncbi:hypothetical protein AMECASPLE_010099 [Ameca splendens]|uniref:Cytoplasmic dynein 2 heavy chain 1-like protein n=1 Tax=Ameca splendens TaxID=208324 RepID=A0ABV0ZYL3_9TELE
MSLLRAQKRKEVFSPNKTAPAAKKKLDTGPEMQDTLNTLVDAISKLSDKVDTLGSQMQQNSAMLASIAKSVEFNVAEIKGCKVQLQVTLHEVSALKEDKKQMMERLLELERYKRRWNLRLKGVKEKEGENTRDLVADLLLKIIPEWSLNINGIIDTVHRLGHREENRTTLIIIQFAQRVYRDLLWRKTKESAICKELGIRFTEDLCPADRETRAALWPKIQQARAAGKKAYYRGGDGFIDGQKNHQLIWTRYAVMCCCLSNTSGHMVYFMII